jgi:hypothetical protein
VFQLNSVFGIINTATYSGRFICQQMMPIFPTTGPMQLAMHETIVVDPEPETELQEPQFFALVNPNRNLNAFRFRIQLKFNITVKKSNIRGQLSEKQCCF